MTTVSLTKKQLFDKRLESLRTERADYFDYWGQLSDYHLAHRGRFLDKSGGRKVKRNTKQYNNTSRLAVRSSAAGLMAGITPASRPWFKLKLNGTNIGLSKAVQTWLFQVQTILEETFAASNTYNMLHPLYSEIVTFGIASMGVFEDPEHVIRCKTYTVGSYLLGAGANDVIDTHYREYGQTAGQLVKQYGKERVSHNTRTAWDRGNIELIVPCVHAVEPNDNRDSFSPFAIDMPFRSVYYEKGASRDDGMLFESGFEEFPFMTPRWDVSGEEVYAEDCPGMMSIGDSKGLQLGERRFYQALDKVGNPPLIADSDLRSQVRNGPPGPGDTVWRSNNASEMKPIYGNYKPDIKSIRGAQEIVEARIDKAFYVNLFLMLANDSRKQPVSAREVVEKHEEKLLQLGPVLERLHTELLSPLIDRTFNILQRAGRLPPPPDELVNTVVTVDFISILAQAQKMVGLTATERVVGFAGEMAAIWPEARHKINSHQVIDQYAEDAGVDPRIIRSDKDAGQLVQAENEQRAKAAQLEQQGQQVEQAAQVAAIPAALAGAGAQQ